MKGGFTKTISGLVSLSLLLSFFASGTTPVFAATFDSYVVMNPRVVDGYLAVDIQPPGIPDNICAWWQQLHSVYLTNASGQRVGGFGTCGNNPDGSYTMSGGQADGYLPDTGTYRVEVYEPEQPPHPYDALSMTFDWTSPVPHVNRPPAVRLFDSPRPLPDLPQYQEVWHNLGQTYTVNGTFTDVDSTAWTATVDYGDGGGVQPLTLDGSNFSLSHTYARGGWTTATVTVTDDQGAAVGVSRVVKVIDYNLVVSNPRIEDSRFSVDLRGNPPDNICSWFPAFRHDAYLLNENNQRVGGFGSCSNNPDGSYTLRAWDFDPAGTPPNGTYKVQIVESEQPPYPYITASNPFVWTAPSHDPVTTSFSASADTYVKSGLSDRNTGAGEFMRLRSDGNNRALLRFDQGAMQAAIGSSTVLSAKLRLTVVDNGNNWGATGRTVAAHRLLADWAEGNGTEAARGSGPGATWNCAVDSLIENQAKNCSGSTEWEMGQPNNPAIHPWAEAPTASQTITNGQTGVVEYDVTADVNGFLNGASSNYGWIIKKVNENQAGQIDLGTRESAFVPELIVTYQP